ncbi:MAG: PAS domain S-box protein, partial [Verrucomicrobiota bacterium]
LNIFYPVWEHEKFVGTLFLSTDLTPVYQRVQVYGAIVLAAMIGLFLMALLVSRWFQKGITRPIQELAGTATAIAINRDYLVRAKKYSEDELGLFTDAFNHMLTQIHERDAALAQNEERLRLSLESSRTGTWDWNIEAETFKWDRYMHRLLGVEEGEFDGRLDTFLNHIHSDDRTAFFRQLNRALEQKTDFISEFRVIWPEKSVHYLSSRGRAFYNEKGKPVRMLSVTVDITESKDAAEAMSLLAAIVESSDDAIVGKNLFGKIVSWNAGATGMFGYSPEEAVGRTSALIMPPECREEEVFALQRVQQGRIEHYETVRLRKNGQQLHVSVTMSPIKNSNGRIIGVSASSRDITDRILAEEEIRKLNTELEERVLLRTSELASTNHELEAFTYSVSHDLRAPLRHIDAFAQMLAEELKTNSSAEAIRYISRIRHGVQNMGKLVDDLLNLSRVGRREVSRKRIALNSIIEEVLFDLQPEYTGRTVEWKIGQLPVMECDAGLIKQVFTNLISNAIKYSRPRDPAIIEIDQTQIDGRIAIFIRDNGVGFNMKYIDKLFGVFQRLHRVEEFEGTGVGLATVQRIIRLHSGKV